MYRGGGTHARWQLVRRAISRRSHGKIGDCEQSIFRPNIKNPYPSSDLAFRQKSFQHYLSFLRLERKQRNSSNEFRIRIFLFRSYSFGIKMITTFICSRSSLENHTRFQTKMCKGYTRFQTKKAQKPYPLGWHIRICLILECTSPPGGGGE